MAELMEYVEETETWIFRVLGKYRICVEEYDDAEGAQVTAGGRYASEEDVEDISNRLGMPVDNQR